MVIGRDGSEVYGGILFGDDIVSEANIIWGFKGNVMGSKFYSL